MASKDFSKVKSAIQKAVAAPEETEVNNAQEATEAKKTTSTNNASGTQPEKKRGRGEHIRQSYTEEEIAEARAQGKTQGKKGVHARRFNMAFRPEIYEYITIMARVRGQTITQFTEDVFALSMRENAKLYEEAQSFLKKFK